MAPSKILFRFTLLVFYTVFSLKANEFSCQTLKPNSALGFRKPLRAPPVDLSHQKMTKASQNYFAVASKREKCVRHSGRCVNKNRIGAFILDMFDVLYTDKSPPPGQFLALITKENKPVQKKVWKNLLKI